MTRYHMRSAARLSSAQPTAAGRTYTSKANTYGYIYKQKNSRKNKVSTGISYHTSQTKYPPSSTNHALATTIGGKEPSGGLPRFLPPPPPAPALPGAPFGTGVVPAFFFGVVSCCCSVVTGTAIVGIGTGGAANTTDADTTSGGGGIGGGNRGLSTGVAG
jgi:hypothetical protein